MKLNQGGIYSGLFLEMGESSSSFSARNAPARRLAFDCDGCRREVELPERKFN